MSGEPLQTVRGYELHEIIGKGGFGAVYRAHQPVIDRDVAIKVILPKFANDPDFIRNFETEARLVARLEHPFIVPLFDYWRDPQGAYLVMRLFSAGSLHKLLRTERQLSVEKTAKIIEQLGSALDTAHHYQVIHRDIKPDNILLDEAGNAYLTDFGIARQENESEEEGEREEVSGTIAYLAPELLEGGTTSVQSDIYALGLVTYEMLVGKHPFRAESVLQMMRAHIQMELPYMADLSEEVNQILMQAAAKKASDRFTTAGEMAEALQSAIAPSPVNSQATPINPAKAITRKLSINPYKGLRAFEEADAHDFFGREKLVDQIIQKLRGDTPWRNFLAVVGPSGSGKSSVVHAGLLPALRSGQPTGAQNWYIVNMVPGANPLQQLKTSLLSIAINPADTLSTKLQSDPRGLIKSVEKVLGEDDNLLLVIDQFEEVFTLVEREEERQQFLDLLYHAVTAQDNQQLWVIITLRADFYDKPLLYENFGTLMQARTQVVLPLTADELERAISGPAKQVGLEVDTDLVAAIVADVREEPGALPLLQYALTEVFAKRTGARLSLDAYQSSGGVLGALARRAEEVYQDLPTEQQTIAEQIFLRLVSLGEGTEDTRRRVRYSELSMLVKSSATLQTVLDAFGKYRLLTFDRDPATREPTIEVAHEALIREWQRLQEWLDNNRHDIRLQRMLALAASDWQNANQDESYLLSGTRLAQFEEWAQTSQLALAQNETHFLQASLKEQHLQLEAEAERQAQELLLVQRARQRLQLIVGILVIASVIGLGLTAAVYQQSQTAARERDSAQDARDVAISAQATSDSNAEQAHSLTLSTQAQQAFGRGNATLSLLLALEATNIQNPPTEVYNTLLEVAYAPGLRHIMRGHSGDVTAIAISPDGSLALSGVGRNILRNQQPTGAQNSDSAENQPSPSGNPPPNGAPPSNPPPDVNSVVPIPSQITEIEPDSDISMPDNDLILWDLAMGDEIMQLSGHAAPVSDIIFVDSDYDFQAISVAWDGYVIFWNIETGESVEQIEVMGGQHITLSLDANSEILLISSNANPYQDGEMTLWDMNTLTQIQDYPPVREGFWEASLSLDSTRIVASYWGGLQIVWNVVTGEELGQLDIEANGLQPISYHTVLSPDGITVATSGPNDEILLWDIETFTEINIIASPYTNLANIQFTDDGLTIFGISVDNVIGVWNVATGSDLGELYETTNNDVIDFAIIQNAAVGILGLSDGSLQVWNLDALPAGQATWFTAQDLINRAQFVPATADQPLRVASIGGNWNGFEMRPEVLIWDALTGEILQRFGDHEHKYMGQSIAVSANGRWVLSGTTSSVPGMRPGPVPNLMILWDLETGEKVRTFEFENGQGVNKLDFDPTSGTADKPLQAVSNWGRDVRLWNLETGEPIQDFVGHTRLVQSVDFSTDGTKILSTSDDQILRVWDVATGTEIQQIELPSNSRFAMFSPDTQIAVTNSSDNRIFVWDLSTGELLDDLEGHEDRIETVQFSNNGQYLLSGSIDATLILWDIATGEFIRQYTGTYGRVWDVGFSPDDNYILSVSNTDGVVVWDTMLPALEKLIEWIKKNRYLREISELECDIYRLECDDD